MVQPEPEKLKPESTEPPTRVLKSDFETKENPISPPRQRISIAGYQILGELGRGGMGVVYGARSVVSGQLVALKILLRGKLASADDVRRFLLEAEAVAKLRHPGIVQVLEIGNFEGEPFLALEFCLNGSLATRLKEHSMTPREAALFIEAVARAAQFAHEQGIVHRDLKPGNILFDEQFQPKITDFGVAKRMDEESSSTTTGTILGTPSYMAPEQAMGSSVGADPRIDVYSLGAILYECFTGQPPFQGKRKLQTLEKVLREEPVSPRKLEPSIAPDLDTIVLTCLRKNPDQRYQSAAALADDLAAWLAGRPISARPLPLMQRVHQSVRRRPVLAATGGLLTIVAVLGLASLYPAGSTRTDTGTAKQGFASFPVPANSKPQPAEFKTAYEVMRLDSPAGEAGWVNMIAYSKDGNRLASAHAQRVAKIWHTSSGKVNRSLRGHSGWVNTVAFSPDGELVATGSSDGTLRLWDLSGEREQDILGSDLGRVFAIAFSPDGQSLLAGMGDGSLHLYDVRHRRMPREFHGHKDVIRGVAFHPDGTSFISVGDDGKAIHWVLKTGQPLGKVDGAFGKLRSVAISPDGRLAAIGCYNGEILIRDLTTGRVQKSLLGHAGSVENLSFGPHNKRLASVSFDKTAAVWDIETGRKLLDIQGTSELLAVAFSPDGKHVATGGRDEVVRIWDVSETLPVASKP